jgi:fluoroacetyl-CoA thioesterase
VDRLVDVHAEIEWVVAAGDTAQALGSGDVPVLGTPRLIAWLEAAAVSALDGRLPPGATSVGMRIAVDHRAPSAIGDVVRVEAHLVRQEGRPSNSRSEHAHPQET